MIVIIVLVIETIIEIIMSVDLTEKLDHGFATKTLDAASCKTRFRNAGARLQNKRGTSIKSNRPSKNPICTLKAVLSSTRRVTVFGAIDKVLNLMNSTKKVIFDVEASVYFFFACTKNVSFTFITIFTISKVSS